MDFVRKDIHTSILKTSKYSQLTIDDDFNIPDCKDDIENIIATDGNVVVEDVSCEEGKVRVVGVVYFKVMYKTDKDKQNMEVFCGEIPIEDFVNIDGACKSNRAESRCRIEDLTISIINSRKLEVRGLIGNEVSIYHEDKVNAAVDLDNGQGIECQYKKVAYTETAICKRDVFRIKEEIDIPKTKPNISEILWSSVELRNMDTKAGDNSLLIRGEVEIFIIYKGQEEHLPIQYLFSVRAITKEIECQGTTEGMVLESNCALGKGDVTIRQDADGEPRIIGVDYCVDMNIKLYEDKETTLLADLYSPQVQVEPETEVFEYENLLMRNVAKAKVSHRKRIGSEGGKLLQICHIYGNVDIDDVSVKKDGEAMQYVQEEGGDFASDPKEGMEGKGIIHISGVVKCNVLYISSNDDPMNCMNVHVPFEHFVEAADMNKETSIRIVPELDQLGATLLNSEEMEIKAQVSLGISVFEKTSSNIITDMKLNDIDYEKKGAMPGIVGYVVKKDDTIWSIARKYYATTESIRKVNNLESDAIKEGDRLIIVKS